MTLQSTAKRGERIYRERYQAEYEKTHPGKYVVIDVDGARPFMADTPEDALRAALGALPDGQFHLILVGAPVVFRVGYSRCGRNQSPPTERA